MFDMTGCSYSNLDVAVMGVVLRMLGEHYVERLSAMWFYNPPMVFWGLWNSMKGLLPEVTRNKIKVIDPSDISELKALVPPEVSNCCCCYDCAGGGDKIFFSACAQGAKVDMPPVEAHVHVSRAGVVVR
jgi:hypothetical protein